MARTKFPLEVLTPEGEAFAGEVEMVSTFTGVGSIALLANHEALLATLVPTELRIYRSEDDVVRFAQAEGYVQFADNRALLLVEEAIPPEKLDRSLYETKLTESRHTLEQAPEDSEEQARARRDIARYEAFLAVAE
ncbi:MAG TPA: F0F1 ATP synthase subunit epsilon [Solirubrobacteraceae bacterium]|jgi:F-type H+-transporting ATPase subunit epsilon|nr:F0F1 ATP synthase subunit epsilon [Solirubrobacteraceae bacterium]